MNNINPIVWLSLILLAVGGINWGLVGLFEYDLVAAIFGKDFGETSTITRIVYILVGASAFVGLAGLAMAQMKLPSAQSHRGGQSQMTSR